MADVKLETTRVDLSTGSVGTTQDITIAGFGTPVAAMFFFSDAAVDDTIISDVRSGVGFTDGTNQAVCTIFATDNASESVCKRAHRDDALIAFRNAAGTHTRYSFNSWITDGVRIEVDDDTGIDRLCTVVLIGGSDVGAVVGTQDDLGNTTAATTITTGHETSLVFITTTGNNAAPPAEAVHSMLTFGAAINDGLDTQRVAALVGRDQQATTESVAYLGNDSVIGQVFNNSLSWDAVIGNFTSTSFDITPNSGAGDDIIFYLSLNIANNPDLALFDMEWPTSGNYAETNPGFEPTFGLITSHVGVTARNSVATSGVYGFSLAAFDDTSIFTTNWVEQDNVSVTEAKSLSSDRLRILDDDGSTDSVIASGYAFDADGWDFTLTTNPGSAVLGWGLAIGAGDTGVTGDGDLISDDSIASGTGEITKTGSGTLQSDDSTMSGSGSVEGAITGEGDLFSGNSTLSGTAEITKTGSGTLTSDDSTMSGSGNVGEAITGSGDLVSGDFILSGTAEREITGSGTLESGDSTLSGTGERVITAEVFDLFSGNSTMDGEAGKSINGSGDMESGDSSMDGGEEVLIFGTLGAFILAQPGLTGHIDDRLRQFLESKGFTDDLHNYDLFDDYLLSLGFTDEALWDKYYDATKDGFLWTQGL